MFARRAITRREGDAPQGSFLLKNFSLYAEAGPNGLNHGGSAGIDLNVVATDDAGVFLCGAGAGYASRTLNNGADWTPMLKGMNTGSTTEAIEAIFSFGSSVWVAANAAGGRSRSIDDGANWTTLTAGPLPRNGYSHGAIGTNGVGLIVGNSGLADRTDDSGSTWNQLSPAGLNCGLATEHFSEAGTDGAGNWVVVGWSGYASRSVDNGLTWAGLPRGLGLSTVANPLSAVAAGPNGTWLVGARGPRLTRSTDYGATWTEVDLTPIVFEADLVVYINNIFTDGAGNWLAVPNTNNPTTGANGTYVPAVYSCDDGVTWQKAFSAVSLKAGSNAGLLLSGKAAYAPSDNTAMFVCADGYNSRNVPGHDSLAPILNAEIMLPVGLSCGSWTLYNNVASADGTVVVVVGDSGFASRSDDGGDTWTCLLRGLNSGNTVTNFESVDTDGQGVWVAVGNGGRASRSVDNGLTWAGLPRGLNSGSSSAIFYAVHTDKAGIWVAAASSGYASRSVDNGATWNGLPRGLNSGSASTSFNTVHTDGSGVWMAAGSSGYAARSVDDGATWAAATRGLGTGVNDQARGMSSAPDGTWIAVVSDRHIGVSRNSGADWASAYTVTDSGHASDHLRTTVHLGSGIWIAIPWYIVAYVSTPGSFPILVSVDNATTWYNGLADFGFTEGNEESRQLNGACYSNGVLFAVGSLGRASRTIVSPCQ